MKRILLSLFILYAILFSLPSNAQCDLSFPNLARAISSNTISLGPDKCQYTVNLEFEIVTNSGFKYLFFHSWLADDYPNPPIFDCTRNTPAVDPGTSVQLGTALDEPGKSFNDFGFESLNTLTFPADVPVDVTANFATIYPHDPSVELTMPSNSPGMTATITRLGNSDTLLFSINNMRVIINEPCGTPIIIRTDIWGSNANAPDPKAQCYICGLAQSFGNPQIALQKICSAIPFQYQLTLTSSGSTQLHVVYRLYADDLDGVREPNTDDSLLFVSDTIILNSAVPYTTGLLDLPDDFCCVDPWAQWGIYAQITAREFLNTLSSPVVEEACATPGTLPVSLQSFTAVRNNSTVMLRWETVSEENSRGFYIERNIGDKWQTMGYVASKAINGNSNTLLTYDYNDINNSKGMTQYRLRQIDIDGKYAYSQVRAVRASGQKGKTIIYPNPSSDGKVNVVFEDKEVIRDITLVDMNGRVVKQWQNVRNNTLKIENLVTGIYTVRILNKETGEQIVEKFVIQNR